VEKDSIDLGQTEGLVKFSAAKNKLLMLVSVFIAFSIFITGHALYSIYEMLTDDSIPMVICPRTDNLDAPVVMNVLKDTKELYIQDRWIRGFVRRYILNLFPRTQDDAEPFYTYVRDHSKGKVKVKYDAFLNDINRISESIKSGNKIMFYPKNSTEVRIDRTKHENEWIVEVDGYMIKQYNGEERTTPTVRFTVEAGEPTKENPEGLYVTDLKTKVIADYVSGREVEVIDDKDTKNDKK